ncbi:hypothetical protein GCM10009789_67390 [Kribbella sancticallisti]|uniref:Uncharacterized protein n=1 Tax=Kribbella sancticallisti TaxID=460087 RepID=A0ABP4Q9L0_9ACTN
MSQVNSTPQLQGYELDQRLLEHPLAEIWRGRSFTGMEVVALVLSESGAADPQVRDRLDQASRGAALEPGEQQTPLWAANLSADRPYAITQLIPGQSGAERLLDPLDGLLGNDEESLSAVRSQLAQYGAAPLNQAQQKPPSKVEVAREYRHKLGRWTYLVAAIGVLIVFTALYSVGAAIGSSIKDQRPAGPPIATAVSPSPLPSPGLLPGVPKPRTAPYLPPVTTTGLVGATYPTGADVQVVDGLSLPFAFGWPRPPHKVELGESSTMIYRRVLTEAKPTDSALDARIALRPCRDLAACLAGRAQFDKEWTDSFKTPVPASAKDARTWLTVQKGPRYTLTMTRAYTSAGRSWLVGVTLTGAPGEEPAIERVLNDIWRQTQ